MREKAVEPRQSPRVVGSYHNHPHAAGCLMDTLDQVISSLKQNPQLLDPLAQLLELVRRLTESAPRSWRESERDLLDAARHLSCAAQQAVLQAFDLPSPEALVHQGRRFERTRRAPKTYLGLDGPVRLERWLYHGPQGQTLCPLELRAGIVEGRLTPAAARLELLSTAGDDYLSSQRLHEAAHLLGARTKSSLERDVVAMSPKMREHMGELEQVRRDELARREPLEGVATISVSVDRTGLPLEEPVRRGPGRPKKGAPKRPCQVVKRQCYCACLTLHDGEGRALSSQRFAGLPTDGDGVVERAGECLDGLLRGHPEARLVGVCDGAAEMRRRVREIAGQNELEAELVDAWHAVSYVSQAFGALGHNESYRQEMVRRVLENKTGVEEALLRLRTAQMERELEEVGRAVTFLENNRDRMDYVGAREQGLPIGSGGVEATCKCVVAVRFKRSGARWKPEGAEPLLHVRSWLSSDQRVAQPMLDAFLDSYVESVAA